MNFQTFLTVYIYLVKVLILPKEFSSSPWKTKARIPEEWKIEHSAKIKVK